ncbi:putative phospholipase B-like 2 [Lepeophtheirus salmonis]|uniref:putative phospholipase B-like 2 n=1 Tax=Lepeophtheirus salmonis TaxID=72036 RepID=UPI001AE365DC|nr:putative phospholipase B-like 2 [Lepeophtheirus salmonis]
MEILKGSIFPIFLLISTRALGTSSLKHSLSYDGKDLTLLPGHVSGSNILLHGSFVNLINQTGWSILKINTMSHFPDNIQAYGAGYIEAYMTKDLIYNHWRNTIVGYCDGKEKICEGIQGFLSKNLNYIRSMTTNSKREKSSYWHHVALFYDQIRGITEGYNKYAPPGRSISAEDIFFMNVMGDVEDLEQVFSHRLNISLPDKVLGSGSCSALIRLLPGNRDLYAAHDTWNSYQSMLRIIKKYKFGLHWVLQKFPEKDDKHTIPGRSMSFSGYPGTVFSMDDFNVIPSSGLVSIETTIGNGNASLWQYVQPIGTVLEGIRATVANRLARSGGHWVSVFSKRNSGTYNNQWMVVDYKRFKPGEKIIRPGLLWVLEQIPGRIHYTDVTGVLKKIGYWPSYNSPYFKDIFNMSGGPEAVAKFGNWFSYEKTPRALIFKRDAPKVHNMGSMMKIMRYNDFRHDPISRCNCTPPYSAENAISARCDLNPKNGTYPFGALGHRSHGGTDMKITSFDLFMKGSFIAGGGPTYDSVEPFQWSKADFGKTTPHFGHPDKWAFKPIKVDWENAFNRDEDVV